MARGYCLEVLDFNVSQRTIEMIGEPYRDDFIDNCNGHSSDGVELFGVDEHTVSQLQRLYRRT